MQQMPEGWERLAYWLIASGALLGVAGSAMRAWFTIREYKGLLRELEIPGLLRSAVALAAGRMTAESASSMRHTTHQMERQLDTFLSMDADTDRRYTELLGHAFAWTLILVGAAAGFAASVIRLWWEYH